MKIEELHTTAVLGGDVIDPFNHLSVFDPAVWVKDKVENALLEDGGIDGGFPVPDCYRVAWPVEVLCFPIAWNHARHFPNPAAYGVWIGVVFDRDDVRVERNVFFKFGFAVRIGDEVCGQHRVGFSENIEHRTVHLEKLSGRIVAHQQLGKNARARRVLGVATRRAEGDRQVVGDVVHQVHAAVVGIGCCREVALGQNGAGMGQRVNLDAKSITEPLLQKGFTWSDGITKDTDRGASIDLLQPVQDGAAE